MPFKSKAQHRKFRAMLANGEISQETFDKWMSETGDKVKHLPEKTAMSIYDEIYETAFNDELQKVARSERDLSKDEYKRYISDLGGVQSSYADRHKSIISSKPKGLGKVRAGLISGALLGSAGAGAATAATGSRLKNPYARIGAALLTGATGAIGGALGGGAAGYAAAKGSPYRKAVSENVKTLTSDIKGLQKRYGINQD